ncbi:MAG: NAD(P)/FAD-dependent oxidoreductase [Armatimonadetes bacterium]|nr:NAD(P)/FAD-dependent oxidoreductase [Armatimonadota bacterium]
MGRRFSNRLQAVTQPALRSNYDAVVVGSGHNGLVAAAYLARVGKCVLVLERNATLGGATASKKVFPDYEAYLSTYSYLVSLLPPKIIADLGLQFETKRRKTASFTPYTKPDGSPGGLVLSNVDPSRSQASMAEMTGDDRDWAGYQHFVALEQALAAHVWPSFLSPLQSRTTFASSMSTDLEREAWRSFVEEPLGTAIEKIVQHDALRGLLMTDGKIGVFTRPDDPTLLQNRCFLYHVVGGGDGEWRVPVGGMKSLVESLLDVCHSHGVEFLTGAEATSVSQGAKTHAVSFRTDSGDHAVDATHVLLNAGPRTSARLLGQPWQADPANEGSVIKINMLLRRLPKLKAKGVSPEEAFAGSFHIDEGYGQMLASYASASNGQLPDPAPGEIYCHTLTDPSILSPELAQQGYQTLTLFGLDMPYRLFNADHDAKRQHVLELYLAGLDRLCDGSFLDCLARDRNGDPCLEIKTPQDIEAEIDMDQGNIFHDAPSWFFAENTEDVGTWGVDTGVPRVYRAGSSALRGGAVSGIPGHNAAMRVLLG